MAEGKTTLTLPPNMYVHIRDTTASGIEKTLVGSTIVDPQGQDKPFTYNPETREVQEVPLAEAAQLFPEARQGHYVRLLNPAIDGSHPGHGIDNKSIQLRMGCEVNIHGPWSQALFPRQVVEVIPGHRLQRNQYVVAEVLHEGDLRESWKDVEFKLAAEAAQVDSEPSVPAATKADVLLGLSALTGREVAAISVGQQLVIRGDRISFFMPPTGMRVIKDAEGQYVRTAPTLEDGTYCILIDQSGDKRYVYGAEVAFPRPTEKFHEHQGAVVFRCPEVSKLHGIYLTVAAKFTDEAGDYGPPGTSYEEGQELFVQGWDKTRTRIFKPRPELRLITYDGQSKHFATAIARGDGRYVLERHTGKVDMVPGEAMLLPDPRTHVIARRVLTAQQCALWYPGNQAVLVFNESLRQVEQRSPTTRSGVVSEGDVRRSGKKLRRDVSATLLSSALGGGYEVSDSADSALRAMGRGGTNMNVDAIMGADQIERKGDYTQPRTVQLGESWGVPRLRLQVGSAVCVTDSAGGRRVVVGPDNVLLQFDEDLQVLALSTGKPKNTDRLYETVYLQILNNKVADIISAVTADHVNVQTKVSLRVSFEGDTPEQQGRWFESQNYVKLICDHVRSVLKNAIRGITVEDWHQRAEVVVRDAILGERTQDGRAGMAFSEISARIVDVEVLDASIQDEVVARMLVEAQRRAVQQAIELKEQAHNLDAEVRRQDLSRRAATARAETEVHSAGLRTAAIERDLGVAIQAALAEQAKTVEQTKMVSAQEAVKDISEAASRQRTAAAKELEVQFARAFQEIELAGLAATTATVVERFQAGSGTFAEAILALRDGDLMARVAEAAGPMHFLGGKSLPDVIGAVLGDAKVAGLISAVAAKRFKTNGQASTPAGAAADLL